MVKLGKKNRERKDFEVAMLPQNRKELFFDMVKLQWGKLLLIGVLVFLFAMPLYIFLGSEGMYVVALQANPSLTAEEQWGAIVNLRNTNSILSILPFLLLFAGLSGIIRIVRQMAWLENVFMIHDFAVGFKQNGKQCLLGGLLFGIVFALARIGMSLSIVSDGVMRLVFAVPIGFVLLLALPVFGYLLPVIAIYNNPFGKNLKLAFLLYARNPFKAILATGLSFGLVLLPWAIPIVKVQLIGGAIGILLGGFALFGWMLFVLNQLDKYVNSLHFPQLVGRGLCGK